MVAHWVENEGDRNQIIGVFSKCFHWIRLIQWQKYYYFKKIAGLKLTISCVSNRDYTTVPQTHS